MTQHPIQTQLPDDDYDAFVDYCAHVRRSQAWVAREAIKEYLTKQQNLCQRNHVASV